MTDVDDRPRAVLGTLPAGPAVEPAAPREPAGPSGEPGLPEPVELRRPGSEGEHRLQAAHGTTQRATTFYTNQVRDHLLTTMVEFIERMTMVFVATSGPGRCHSSVRTGSPGFLHVVDGRRLALPEPGRGTDVADDVAENPHVGLLMVDFESARIGLHVNGAARVVDDAAARAEVPDLPAHPAPGPDATWVLVEVEEAYIHCRKHIPRMTTLHRDA